VYLLPLVSILNIELRLRLHATRASGSSSPRRENALDRLAKPGVASVSAPKGIQVSRAVPLVDHCRRIPVPYKQEVRRKPTGPYRFRRGTDGSARSGRVDRRRTPSDAVRRLGEVTWPEAIIPARSPAPLVHRSFTVLFSRFSSTTPDADRLGESAPCTANRHRANALSSPSASNKPPAIAGGRCSLRAPSALAVSVICRARAGRGYDQNSSQA